MNIFIWIFFVIGIVAVVVALLPAIIEVIIYFCSIFSNFKTDRNNKTEVRKAKLNKKKETKLTEIADD